MMKKRWLVFTTLLMVMLLFWGAVAESVDISSLTLDELNELKVNVEKRIAELTDEDGAGATDDAKAAEGETGAAAGDAAYPELSKGAKGDEVKRLQERLIELKYMSGKADGDYGNKTVSAIRAFQSEAGLEQTGIADAETQELLYSDDAPVPKNYGSFNFKKVSRDPDQYEGDYVQFKGKVLQVLEDDTYAATLGTYTEMRIATRGRYNDVVYVTYWRTKNSSRILEDDSVTVYGQCKGLYSYTSTMGKPITLPLIEAERIE